MITIDCYLTKDFHGIVELWKSKPILLCIGEYGGEPITDDGLLDNFLKEGDCKEIQIKIK